MDSAKLVTKGGKTVVEVTSKRTIAKEEIERRIAMNQRVVDRHQALVDADAALLAKFEE